MKGMKFCRKEICEGCWGDLPPSHGPACFMNCMHGCVHALQSRAKEREIIVNPIQCLVHPFDKPEKNCFFPISSPFRLCPPCVQSTDRHRLAELHLTFFPHPRTLIQTTSAGSPPHQHRRRLIEFYLWFKRKVAQAFCASGPEIWRWRQILRFSVGLGLD